ncbi:MAG: NAD(P)H-binding protein [Polyangiaceae bacterium]
MRIVVNTPTGNIGRALVELLLARGAEVTLIARTPDKVRDLESRGARVVQGSIDDAAVVERALEGASALFWLTPPAARPDWLEWGVGAAKKAAEAARRRDVKRIVILSSLGAQAGRGTGPVSSLLEIEDAFRAVAPDVIALRAGFFMENLLRSVDTIAATGTLFAPFPPDAKAPTVATKDIAAVAAEELVQRGGGHRIRGVHGPADLSSAEQAAILSEVLHTPIAYVQVPVEAVEKGMRDAGMPDFAVSMFGEMYRSILSGKMVSAEPRSPETTTPTTFAEFARDVVRPAILASRAAPAS